LRGKTNNDLNQLYWCPSDNRLEPSALEGWIGEVLDRDPKGSFFADPSHGRASFLPEFGFFNDRLIQTQ
jgi:hypothetical protein